MSEEYEQYVWHPYVLTGDHAYWSSSETKALAGQHLGTGPKQINLESTLAELNINDQPNPLTPLQQQAKVLHLIKSVSGINHEAAAEDGLLKKEKDSGTVNKLYLK